MMTRFVRMAVLTLLGLLLLFLAGCKSSTPTPPYTPSAPVVETRSFTPTPPTPEVTPPPAPSVTPRANNRPRPVGDTCPPRRHRFPCSDDRPVGDIAGVRGRYRGLHHAYRCEVSQRGMPLSVEELHPDQAERSQAPLHAVQCLQPTGMKGETRRPAPDQARTLVV